MTRSSPKLACLTIAASLTAVTPLCAQMSHATGGFYPGGTVSGVIVDAEGIPQMGALVQFLQPDTTPAATALTDSNGRYRVTDLRPGRYRVRVSAALFLPAIRQTLLVAANTRAVVNLTLSTLLAPTQWLPATRRSTDTVEDDWMWTLRSSAMRPVLRLGDDSGTPTGASVSSSARDRHTSGERARMALFANDGSFARGGNHQVFTLERAGSSGSASVVRADFSGPRVPYPVAPSAEVSLGSGRSTLFGGTSRTVLSYLSHPELLNGQGNNGMQAMVLRNGQRMEFGDTLRLDAGSVTEAFNLNGNVVAVEPFVRASYRPGGNLVVAYAFTAARGTSQLDDLTQVAPRIPVAVRLNGGLRLTGGHTNSISGAIRTGRDGKLELSAYRESIVAPLLSGVGTLGTQDYLGQPVVTDPTTQTFVVAGRDFSGSGVRMLLDQPLNASLSLVTSVATGSVLSNRQTALATVTAMGPQLMVENGMSASVRARAHFARTGTRAEAGYRWQRARNLTAVDSFRTAQDPAYLSLVLRQSLQRLPLLPNGLEAVIQVQNLLAAGYQPFLSSDGRTLYLAQSPRMLQAGLAFTF